MSKIAYAALILIGLLVGAFIVYAITTYTGDQTATATGLTILLESLPLEDGDPIDWGEVTVDVTYSYNLSVTNNHDSTVLVYLYTPGLPAGWVETWECNGTALTAGSSMWGWLDLTATTAGSHTWGWNITAT